MLVASVPLYVCATASVPIAASRIDAGLPTGAALVFLMAGPATNVATLGAIWRGFGGRAVAGYLGTIVVGSMALGMAYEPLLGSLTAQRIGGHEHMAWWAQGAAGILLAGFVWFAVEDLQAAKARHKAARVAARAREIPIAGMTCGGRAARLQRVMNAHVVVETATVSFDTGLLVVTGRIDAETIRGAVEGAGFQVVTPG